ncbi:Uncharacterised protein [Mycobacteroides abscessus subsp. abscessus]|nr:Uncharacterised protein [Mycobacteroides abscessus subsp. abscessus]
MPITPSPPLCSKFDPSALNDAATTNATRMATSIATTNISDLPTSFDPIAFTPINTMTSPTPMALPDQSGVSKGNRCRA